MWIGCTQCKHIFVFKHGNQSKTFRPDLNKSQCLFDTLPFGKVIKKPILAKMFSIFVLIIIVHQFSP